MGQKDPSQVPHPSVPILEVSSIVVVVNVPTTSAGPVVVSSSPVNSYLLSVGLATASAPLMSPPPSSAPLIPTFGVLVMLIYCGAQVTGRSRRPRLALCQPSTKI